MNPSTNSLTLELIHRDQLIPPAATVSNINTREALLLSRLERDRLRVEAISNHAAATTTTQSESMSHPLSSGLSLGGAEYVVSLGVGTPAKQLYLALDTASDITWLQCNQSDPIFDPRNSTSFSPLSCDNPQCQLLDDDSNISNCSYHPNSSCLYDFGYITGNLSTETLTFGKARVENITIGCGQDYNENQVEYAGFISLGRGYLSLPRQIGNSKFSYCLASIFTTTDPLPESSSITFGDSQIKANFTPLLQNPDPKLSSLYYVSLKGISVEGSPVSGITPSHFEMSRNGSGGVVIDTSLGVTYLNQKAYYPLREAFKKTMNMTATSNNTYNLDMCYDFSGKVNITVPSVVLHFDGVDMDLPFDNYMLNMDNNGTYCFGFLGKENISVIGNIIQQGFRVSYDLDNNQIGFTRNACPMP